MSETKLEFLEGSGITWTKIPKTLIQLRKNQGITSSDVLLAISMLDYAARRGHNLEWFAISYKNLAKIAFCTPRQAMIGVQRLIELRLISCVSESKLENKYKFSEHFLREGAPSENLSHGQMKIFHIEGENLSQEDVKDIHSIYIDLLIDKLYIFYRDYFATNQTIAKRIPAKKIKKSGDIIAAPQGSGTTVYLSREQAWREAISWAALSKAGYVRTYLALMGGFNIDEVDYPTAWLKKVLWDESRQYESKKKSYLYSCGYLDDDDTFLQFILKNGEEARERKT